MDAVQKMNLFSTLVQVSLAVAIVGFLLAVLFFFLFDIRNVYALRTGKAKRDAIERMAEQNNKTGRLRGASGKIKDSSHPVIQTPSQVRTADIQSAPATAYGMTEMVGERPAEETTVLQTAEPETTVLAMQPESETTVLAAPAASEPAIRFDVTESTLVIHTNEII